MAFFSFSICGEIKSESVALSSLFMLIKLAEVFHKQTHKLLDSHSSFLRTDSYGPGYWSSVAILERKNAFYVNT